MSTKRASIVFVVGLGLAGGAAWADDPPPADGTGAGVGVGVGVGVGPVNADASANANATTDTSSTDSTSTDAADGQPAKQGKGSFDAGGQLRFPSGPDEMGKFGTFNWVALDLQGRYFLTDGITVTGTIPLAPIKQGDAELLGGFTVRPELALGKTLGLGVTLGMLREGAFLLSQKDYPLYLGDLKFGAAVGPWLKVKKFGLDLMATPSVVYQAGDETLTAIQVPLAAQVSLGSALKVSVEAGVYTGDDFKLGAADGGRVSLGGAIDVKIGKIIAHAGAGVATLLTDDMGGLYPSIGDSIYVDVNAKFAK